MVLLRSDIVNARLRFSNSSGYVAILGITFPRQITKILIMQKPFLYAIAWSRGIAASNGVRFTRGEACAEKLPMGFEPYSVHPGYNHLGTYIPDCEQEILRR
jgi:hypothetical protein